MLSRSPSRTPSRSPPKGYTDAQPSSSQHTSDMQTGSSHDTSNSADLTHSPERRSPLSRASQSQPQHSGRVPASPFGRYANSPPGATGSSPAGMSTSSHSAMQVSAALVTYTLQKGHQPSFNPMKEWKQQRAFAVTPANDFWWPFLVLCWLASVDLAHGYKRAPVVIPTCPLFCKLQQSPFTYSKWTPLFTPCTGVHCTL